METVQNTYVQNEFFAQNIKATDEISGVMIKI